MSKATHDGSCQICGSVQRLPSGKLAKHGYTTQWGFFSGVCPGSGSLPFEQSKGLIDAAIARAQADAAKLTAEAIEWRNGKQLDDNKAWRSVWIPATGMQRGGYQWGHVVVKATPFTSEVTGETRLTFSFQKEGDKREQPLYMHSGTLDQTRTDLNKGYAAHLDKRAAELQDYAKWQQARIANWAPAELRARA